MMKRFAIGVLALAAFGCDQQDTTTTPSPSAPSAPATAPATSPATMPGAAAGELDVRETRLVMLKLPGMV